MTTIKEQLNILANNVDIDVSKNYGSPISGYTIQQQLDIIYNSIGSVSPEPPTPPEPPEPKLEPLKIPFLWLFDSTIVPDSTIDFINTVGLQNIKGRKDRNKNTTEGMFALAVVNKEIDFSKVKFSTDTPMPDRGNGCTFTDMQYVSNVLDLSKSDFIKSLKGNIVGSFEFRNSNIDTIIFDNEDALGDRDFACFDNNQFTGCTKLKHIVLPTSNLYSNRYANINNFLNGLTSLETVENFQWYLDHQNPQAYRLITNCPNLVIDTAIIRQITRTDSYPFFLSDNSAKVTNLIYDLDFQNNNAYWNLTNYSKTEHFTFSENVPHITLSTPKTLNCTTMVLLNHEALVDLINSLPVCNNSMCNLDITGIPAAAELTVEELAVASSKNWNVIGGGTGA